MSMLFIYNACAKQHAQECQVDVKTKGDLMSPDEKTVERSDECERVIACVAANDSSNCLADIKKHVIGHFSNIGRVYINDSTDREAETDLAKDQKSEHNKDGKEHKDIKRKKFKENPQGLVNLLKHFAPTEDK